MSIDLTTKIGKLQLRSPLIVGSCPMTTDSIQRIAMISNGVGAIVLPSFNTLCNESVDEYLNQLNNIAEPNNIPVFASVRTSIECRDWFDLPAQLENAGAAAIELSLEGCNSDVADPRKLEDDLVELTRQVDIGIDIPLYLKLTRNFTSISNLAERLRPHVQGIVMFGRSPVIDIELENMSIAKKWGLTQPGSVVNILEPMIRTRKALPEMPLVACGGIGNSEDLIKSILAGANAAMVTSALYRNGTVALGVLRDGLIKFMSDHGVSSISELQALCPSLVDSTDVIQSNSIQSKNQDGPDVSGAISELKCDRFGHIVNTD